MQQIESLLAEGEYEDALHKLATCEHLAAGSVDKLLALGELYVELGHVEQGERLAEDVLARDDTCAAALALKGDIALQRGDGFAAVHVLEQAHALAPHDAMIVVALADAYLAVDMADAACAHLTELVQQNPGSPYYLLALGTAQLASGQATAAVETLTAAYALEEGEGDPDVLAMLAEALVAAGEWEASIPYLAEAERLQPENSEHALKRASLLFHLGELEEAVELLTRLVAKDGDNVDALTALGEANLALARFSEAKKAWRRVYELNPHHTDALFALGRIATHEQQYEKAIDYYERAQFEGDERVDLLLGMAEAYQGMEEWSEALRYYKQISSDRAGGTETLPAGIYREMAHCYKQLEAFAEAVSCLQKEAAQTDIPDTSLLNELADAHLLNGERREACNCWQRSLAQDPTQWDIADLYERNCDDV